MIKLMNNTNFFKDIKSLLIFATPIIFGQLGQMLIGAGDVFVAARHSANTVASISIANAITTIIFMTGFGLLTGVSPILSKIRGEKGDINRFLNPTLLYTGGLSLIVMLAFLSVLPLIPYIGCEELLIPDIQQYIYICVFSIPGAYAYHALKEFLQTYENVIFANIVAIAAIFLNLLLAWMLVFGWWIVPSIGVKGLAVSTVIVRTLMGLALVVYCHKYFTRGLHFDIKYFKNLTNIGFPMSLSFLLEMSAFSVVTLLSGRISTTQVAAHSIVMTFTSITFMIPLAISSALGVRVGYAYGAKSLQDMKDNLTAALSVSVFVMSIFALVFFAFPQYLMAMFSPDKEVILTGVGLLFIAALFQMFDGAQITLSGALRGLGATKAILFTMICSYWFIGIPVGMYLAFVKGMQIYGLWAGLAIALFVSVIIFGAALKRKLKLIFNT